MNTELIAQVRQTEEAARSRVETAKLEAEKIVDTAKAEVMEKYDEAFDLTHKRLIEGTFKAESDSTQTMNKEIENGRKQIAETIECAQKNYETAVKAVIGELVAK